MVLKQDILKSEILISFGVYDDCTFELDFRKINPVKILAFDASVGHYFFLTIILKSIFRLNKPFDIFKKTRNYLNYLRFISGGSKHFKKFISEEITKNHSIVKNLQQ